MAGGPEADDRLFAGPGEMRTLCRSLDWSATPLGPPQAWPQALRTAVGIVLGAGSPMSICWGTELVLLYNDAWKALFGGMHLQALGRPVREAFPRALETVGPMLMQVLAGGEPVQWPGQRLPSGPGAPGTPWVDFSLNPIPGEDGRVGGTLNLAVEATDRVRGQEALRGSEARYRTLFDSIDEGFCVLQLIFDEASKPVDWRYIEINAAFERHTGMKDALGRSVRELIPGLEPTWFDIYGRVALTGEPSRFVDHARPMGRWFDVYAFRIGEPQARQVAVLFNDITARKRAEEALRRSEEQFRLMADAAPQIVWIADADGRVEFFNGQWTAYTGRPYEPTTAAEVAATAVHPDDAALTMERFDEARRTGETFLVEHRIRSAAGDYRWFLVRGEPYRDPDSGRILRWFGASVDIHDRKLAEETLRASEARQRFLLQLDDRLRPLADPEDIQFEAARALGEHLGASRVGYAEAQADGESIVVTRNHADGVPGIEGRHHYGDYGATLLQELEAGRTVVRRDIAGDPALSDAEKRAHAALQIGAIVNVPLVKGGRLVAVLFVHDRQARAFPAEELALVEAVAERTWAAVERARAEAALRAEDRRKDEFLATLAHELRNPLAPVRTGLQILRLSPDGGPNAAKALGMMERQLAHMVRLIDDLLDVSRIRSGKVALRRERLTLRAVLDSAVEASRPLIEAGRHALTLRLPGEPLHLDADPTRLAQVIGNLLNNAAKYTPDGGAIELAAWRDGGEAVIRVADSGVGIPREMLPKVFDLFAQVDRTMDRAQGGLGIGLSISRRLVEMHQGRIDAESPGPGRGTVLTVRLPLAQEPAPQDGAGGGTEDGSPGPSRRVLVVDDNVDAADSLAMMLGLFGHEARTAHGGAEALGIAREFRPLVVFCDIGMPGMSGYEVARRLREAPEFARTLLVALTGWGSEEDRRKALEAGFDRHLTKPVDPAQLPELLALAGAGRG